jgi:hypothetical protein
MVVLVLALFATAVHADGIEVSSVSLEPSEDGWNLDAAFDVQFSPRLEEAVNRGVPLYFVVEFELSRRAGTGSTRSRCSSRRPIA